MIYRINDGFEFDSLDVTGLTFKLARVTGKTRTGIAFFSKIKEMINYITKYYPDLINNKFNQLISVDAEFYKLLNNKTLDVRHNINFYIDDFYFVEFDGDTYILYCHPDLNGNPENKNTNDKPTPNKERKKVVCYPSTINNAIDYYYNQALKDCTCEDGKFLDKIKELISELTIKINDITEKCKTPEPAKV
jgi:hypothetical protein